MKPTEKSLYFLLEELIASINDEEKSLVTLGELRTNVVSFEEELELLEAFIQQIDWSILSDTQFESWRDFVIDAVTAFPHFCFPCVQSVVLSFQQERQNQDDNVANSHRTNLLNSIIFVSPDSVLQLISCLRKYFPHHYRQEPLLTRYYNSLLHVADVIQDIREEIWSILIESLVRLDSEIPRRFFDQYQEYLTKIKQDGVDITEYVSKSGMAGVPTWDPLMLAAKLDSLLSLMMNHLSQNKFFECRHSRRSTINILVSIFSNTVLPACDLSSVHFLWFHLCSLHSKLTKKLIAFLWATFEDPASGLHERQMSVFYISGLVSRMLNIDTSFAQNIISTMVDWCRNYHRACSNTFSFSSAKRSKHLIFYTVFQALMYSLIYLSHAVILDGSPERYTSWCEYFTSFELQSLIHSQILNPLAYCDQRVVEAFAKITAQMQLLLCYPVIQRNKRLVSLMKPRNYSSSSSGDSDTICLSDPSFYPYDPLLLPISGSLVDPNYSFWKDLSHQVHTSNPASESWSSNSNSITSAAVAKKHSSFDKFIEEQLNESLNMDNMQLNFIHQIVS